MSHSSIIIGPFSTSPDCQRCALHEEINQLRAERDLLLELHEFPSRLVWGWNEKARKYSYRLDGEWVEGCELRDAISVAAKAAGETGENCQPELRPVVEKEVERLQAIESAARAFCGLHSRKELCFCYDGYCSACRLRDAVEAAEDNPRHASQIRFVATPAALIRAGEAAMAEIKDKEAAEAAREKP